MINTVKKALFFLLSFVISLVVVIYLATYVIQAFARSQTPTGKKDTIYIGDCKCINNKGFTSDNKFYCSKGISSFKPLNCTGQMYCGLSCQPVPTSLHQPNTPVNTQKLLTNNFPNSQNNNYSSFSLITGTPSSISNNMPDQSTTDSTGLNSLFPNPMDAIPLLQDGIKRLVAFNIISVLQNYWINSQRFPSGSVTDNKQWIQDLADSGELSGNYQQVLLAMQPSFDECGTENQQGFCYISDGKTARLFVQLKSHEEKAACGDNVTFFYWSSTGDLGVVCNQIPY